jgi:ribosomal protein S18 acetylase RimI-like enzyme
MSSPPLSIRLAQPDDAARIAEFNLAMAFETEGRRLDHETVLRGVRAALADEGHGRYYLAERGGEAVGQLLVTREWSDWRDGWFWWIQSVYVTPAARGQGVYRRLHDQLVRQARAAGDVCGVRLYVDEGNGAARAVYGRLGMRETAYRLYEIDWSGGAEP